MADLIGNIRGPQGGKGDKGDKGDTGDVGAAGSRWFAGSGAPDPEPVGSNPGDFYLNTDNGDVYELTGEDT